MKCRWCGAHTGEYRGTPYIGRDANGVAIHVGDVVIHDGAYGFARQEVVLWQSGNADYWYTVGTSNVVLVPQNPVVRPL